MSIGVISGIVTANAGLFLMARIRGANGQLITKAGIASIAWAATDLIASVSVGNGTLPVATSVFDSIQQQDPRWTADSAGQPGVDGWFGYNFAATIPAGVLPVSTPAGASLNAVAPRFYQIDVKFTGADGSVFYAIYQPETLPVFI